MACVGLNEFNDIESNFVPLYFPDKIFNTSFNS